MSYGALFTISYTISSLLCYVIDVAFPEFRVNKLTSEQINKEYKKMLPLCVLNTGIGYSSLCLIENKLIDNDYENNNLFIVNFMLWLVVTDFLFYFLHKLFHLKTLYRFHAIHHEYSYTFGMGAIYAHPLDFLATNIFPVSFPIVIFNIPSNHGNLISLFATIYTVVISHGSFKLVSGRGHLIHHVKRKYNYGLFLFDRLLKTNNSNLKIKN